MEADNSIVEERRTPTPSESELEDSLAFFDNLAIEEIVEPKSEKPDSPAPIDLPNFLEETYEHKIGLLTNENYKNLRCPLIVAVHAFKKHGLKLRNWMDLFAGLSLTYRELKFYIADVEDCRIFHDDCTFLAEDVCKGSVPFIYAVDSMRRQFKLTGAVHIKLVEDVVPDLIKDFCKNLQEDKLFHSQPLPVEVVSSETAVKTAVGYNFQALVEDAEADVLLTVYSDWCRFSKELLPTLDELSLLLRDDAENLSIVKILDELNYIPPEYRVFSYPSVMFIPRDDKKNPVHYRSRRTISDFVKFIATNSTIELKNFDRNGNDRSVSNTKA